MYNYSKFKTAGKTNIVNLPQVGGFELQLTKTDEFGSESIMKDFCHLDGLKHRLETMKLEQADLESQIVDTEALLADALAAGADQIAEVEEPVTA